MTQSVEDQPALQFPDEPEDMRHWRRIIERWDSLHEQAYRAIYPTDDWDEDEWARLSGENQQSIVVGRRAIAAELLKQLELLARELNPKKPGGRQLKTIAADAEREHLLQCRTGTEVWLKEKKHRPWFLSEDDTFRPWKSKLELGLV